MTKEHKYNETTLTQQLLIIQKVQSTPDLEIS